jgi:dCMP deaminase
MNDAVAYDLARLAAAFSRCHNKYIGAVIVKNDMVIGCGSNGPPAPLQQCKFRWGTDPALVDIEAGLDKCPRLSSNYSSGGRLDLCPAIHAEQSAIINCFQSGENPYGAAMYVTCGVPCSRCLASILEIGISEVVVTSMYFYDKVSEWMVSNSELLVREYTEYPEVEC